MTAEKLSAVGLWELVERSGEERTTFLVATESQTAAQFYYLGNVTNVSSEGSTKRSLEMINEISVIHSITFCS